MFPPNKRVLVPSAYRLVEIEDRPDPAPAWWVDGDGGDENEDAGEGSGEGPAPREESPEV